MSDWILLSNKNSSDEDELAFYSSDSEPDSNNDTNTLRTDTEPAWADTSPLQADTSPLRADANTLRADTETVQADTITLCADWAGENTPWGGKKAARAAVITQMLPMVLPRLPAKSLLRFKAASPQFKTFITSPFIILSHSIFPKRVSGLFYNLNGCPHYVSFNGSQPDIPDPSLSYLPEISAIKASTRGVICLRGIETKRYYIANPVTKDWMQLPECGGDHGADVAVVILFEEPDVYNFGGDYQVVCAYRVIEGVFTFETFSSKTSKWAQSSEICVVENIVAASGVAVGAAAYWRTTMQSILEYKPAPPEDNNEPIPNSETNRNNMKGDKWRILYHIIDPKLQYELGEMDGELTITSKAPHGGINIQVLNQDGFSWRPKSQFWAWKWDSEDGASSILRTQGKEGVVTCEVQLKKKDDFDWLAFQNENDDEDYEYEKKNDDLDWLAFGNANNNVKDNEYKEKKLVLRNVDGSVVREVEGPGFCAGFFPFVPTLVPVKKEGSQI